MSAGGDDRHAGGGANAFDRFVLHAISGGTRVVRAWRVLSAERRLAAYGALGLFVALFLPWYQETVITTNPKAATQAQGVGLTGWGAFSLVQAVVLLVALGTLVLLFERAEGWTRQLPGGDGGTIMVAGLATCILIVWGIFNQPAVIGPRQYTTATGVDWGIFIALAVAGLLAYAGSRIRAEVPGAPAPRAGSGAPAPAGPPPAAPRRPASAPRPVAAAPPPSAAPAPATAGAGARAAQTDDESTRVSRRTLAARDDRPTPVSNRRLPVDSPTRVRSQPPEPTTREIGPTVVPEDPPTLNLPDERRPPRKRDDPRS
jgi:hypothetical protein